MVQACPPVKMVGAVLWKFYLFIHLFNKFRVSHCYKHLGMW